METKQYIIIDNNDKIIKIYLSSDPLENIKSLLNSKNISYSKIIISDNLFSEYFVGSNINEYTNTGKLKTVEQRVIDGYISAPMGKKIENKQLVNKTLKNKIDAKEIVLAPYELYDETLDIIRDKTQLELCNNFEEVLEYKLYEINVNNFNYILSTHHFYSSSIGIEVDCRQSGTKNDHQIVLNLISTIIRNNINSIKYKGYTETTTVTLEQLQKLAAEMEDEILTLYQTKWQYDQQIKNATTIEELKNIIWLGDLS
jgi:hypothetical protein